MLKKDFQCFDKPVLREPFILREPQDERQVESSALTKKSNDFRTPSVCPEPVEGWTQGLLAHLRHGEEDARLAKRFAI